MEYIRQNNWNSEQRTHPRWKGNIGGGTRKTVKTFQDLDVYQQALEGNVFVANTLVVSFCRPDACLPDRQADVVRPSGKRSNRGKKMLIGDKGSMTGNIGIGTFEIKEAIMKSLLICSSTIPHQIAEAHSFRFGSQKECLILLEKVMLNCNKMVVYLDQARDICKTGLEMEKFGELQKKYLLIRRKVLNLQRVWQRYIEYPNTDVPLKI